MKRKLIALLIFISIGRFSISQNQVELDYNQFVSRVLEHSKDVKLAANDRQLAKIEKQKALSQLLPQAGAEAGYKRYLNKEYIYLEFPDFSEFQIDPETGEVYLPESWQKFQSSLKNTFSAGALLNQTLFSLQAMNNISAAKSYRKLTAEKQLIVLQEVVLGASKAYYGTILLQRHYAISKHSLTDANKHREILQTKYTSGLASKFDFLQADIEHRESKAAWINAKRVLSNALNNLKLLCNINSTDSLILTDSLDNTFLHFSTEKNINICEVSECKVAQWHTDLLKKELKSSRAAYFPVLKGELGYTYYSLTDKFDPAKNKNSFLHAGLTLNIPLFTGGYSNAKVKEAKVKLLNAELEQEHIQKVLQNKVADTKQSIKESQEHINAAIELVLLTQEAYQLAEVNAEKGLISQRELNEAKLSYEKSRLAKAEKEYLHMCSLLDYGKFNGNLLKLIKTIQQWNEL